jgi:CHASE2 domain-containing sensor protein
MIGVLAGAATAAIFQDAAAIAWFGSELAYLGIAAAVGTVGCVLSWNAQAGPLGLVLGAAGGLISSVPISIVAAFFLWFYGYSFLGQDPIIGSALNGIGTGFWGGLVDGAAGWVATRFVK